MELADVAIGTYQGKAGKALYGFVIISIFHAGVKRKFKNKNEEDREKRRGGGIHSLEGRTACGQQRSGRALPLLSGGPDHSWVASSASPALL